MGSVHHGQTPYDWHSRWSGFVSDSNPHPGYGYGGSEPPDNSVGVDGFVDGINDGCRPRMRAISLLLTKRDGECPCADGVVTGQLEHSPQPGLR